MSKTEDQKQILIIGANVCFCPSWIWWSEYSLARSRDASTALWTCILGRTSIAFFGTILHPRAETPVSLPVPILFGISS